MCQPDSKAKWSAALTIINHTFGQMYALKKAQVCQPDSKAKWSAALTNIIDHTCG